MPISTYGYIAIAVGTFLEGETVLILGGLAAHRGYLELPWVVVWGFLGTLFGDQLYFYIGRIKGIKFLEKRPYWKSKSGRVFDLMHKHQLLLIFAFRFFYGLRTVTPFLLGTAGISPVRFSIFNTLGALVWACVIGGLGYLFGHGFALVIGDIRHYELGLFILLAIAGLSVWSAHWFRRRRSGRHIKPR